MTLSGWYLVACLVAYLVVGFVLGLLYAEHAEGTSK